MAADMAIAEAVAAGDAPPTLRTYRWKPATISLGFHQSSDDIDLKPCESQGIDVVLRPTGGRAILHADELTYSVAIPPDSRFYFPDIKSVYNVISEGLVHSLQKLDIPVEFERAAKTPKDFSRGELSTLCYASSVVYEIGIAGRKLVGSAQRRIQNGVLQHGSILIGPEHLNVVDYMAKGDDRWHKAVRRYMEKNTAYLNEFRSAPIGFADVERAIVSGFPNALDISFEPGELTAAERQRTQALLKDFRILETQPDAYV